MPPKRIFCYGMFLSRNVVLFGGSMIHFLHRKTENLQTLTTQRGRSMVEMLGILAIVGVLSIIGIAGYTYAMNKYHANNVLNEINNVSHQLMIELVTSYDKQKILSLVDPYDNGTMITGNYLFDYGCGNSGKKERKCHVKETGYWISLTNVNKPLCKNIQMSSNVLKYVVYQLLNGVSIDENAVCLDKNNTIMLFFNTEVLPLLICPKNTSPDGLGGLAETMHNSQTGEIIQCYCNELNTRFTSSKTCEMQTETCKSNSDCNRGLYCHITDVGGNKCTKDTQGMTGSCKNTTLKPPKESSNPPFVMSSIPMNWWSADHFCTALGKRLVKVADYKCAYKFCPTGCENRWGYCHADRTIGITTSSTTNISAPTAAMKKAYGSDWSWMADTYSDCYSYHINPSNGYVNPTGLNNEARYAVCTDM